MSAKRIMVVGTGSSVGKSLIVTALCRIYKRRNMNVAPFKSQNMALNSFITPDGHEMGRAQVAQAEAAGLVPSALMNPILLKPTADHKSQVIVNGKVYGVMAAPEYYEFRHKLKPAVEKAFNTLAQKHDLVVIEGAGSPAEINLKKDDLVNMGMAKIANAPVLLVGDIDRGGVFASLYGTIKLLPADEQAMIKGLIINKFRGDLSILAPGIKQLEDLTERPVLGTVPYYDAKIDEEDSLTERFQARRKRADLEVAVIRLPRLSNFTDFAPLDIQDDVYLRYVGAGEILGQPDLVILPGSKNTIEDMVWLNNTGLASQIRAFNQSGGGVIGICGGYQIMGRLLRDPLGIESDVFGIEGLGLLDLETVFEEEKQTTQSQLVISSNKGLLHGCQGMVLEGYEIHMGQSILGDNSSPWADISNKLSVSGQPEGAININGSCFGTYLHGLFDNLEFTRQLLNNLREKKGLELLGPADKSYHDFKENEYDRLADIVESHLDMTLLDKIIFG